MSPHFSLRHLPWIAFAMLLAAIGDANAQGFKFLEVKVVDPDGKPMADVAVEISINGMSFPMPTDEKGMVAVNVPAGEEGELELSVQHPVYMAQGAQWRKGNKTPEQFKIPMKKGTVIGGIVHDEAGKPIAGVKVEGTITGLNENDINGGKGELLPSLDGEIGVTDGEGRWQCDMAPDKDLQLQLRFLHPDYVNQSGFDYRGGTWEELLSLKKIVVMQKGGIVAGKVMDRDRNPVANARIVTGSDRFLSDKYVVTTNQEGKYQLPQAQVGRLILTVTAPGHAPDLRIMSVGTDPPDVDFQLPPGNTIRVRIVDQQGKPIEGVRVYAEEWRGNRGLELSEVAKTDHEGNWEWNEAPSDGVKYGFSKKGHFGLEKILLPRDEVQTLVLHPVVVAHGKVVDKQTRQPLEKFKYVEGVWWDEDSNRYILQTSHVNLGKDGEFEFEMSSPCAKFCIRVDAEGYRSQVSRPIMPDEGNVEIDFELVKRTELNGVVLTPDAAPAQGATVALRGDQLPLIVSNGELQQFSAEASVTTDAEGIFALPVVVSPITVIVLHETGWAELTNTSEDEAEQIKLTAWSSVEGLVYQEEEHVTEASVVLRFGSDANLDLPSQWHYSTTTNSAGKFRFDKLRDGPATVYRVIRYGVTAPDSWASWYSHATPIELTSGASTSVTVSGEGRRIRGQLIAPDDTGKVIDWNMGVVRLAMPDEAVSEMASDTKYATAIDPDGTFEIVDVRPGSYYFKVTVYSKAPVANGRWLPIATLQEPCEIAAGDRREPVDLGTFTVPLIEPQE